jgi:hypothetical protein
MYRLGICVLLCLAYVAVQLPAGGPKGKEKDKGEQKDKDKDKGKDKDVQKDKDKEEQQDKDKDGGKDKKIEEPIKPLPLLGKLELRDGNTLDCEFLRPAELRIQVGGLGIVRLKLDDVRLVDLEYETARIGTHTFDTFQGPVEATVFRVRLLTNRQEIQVRTEDIRRMAFPPQRPKIY